MAVAYSTIGNGGTVVRPHIGNQVEDATGRVVQEIDPGRGAQVDVEPAVPLGDPGGTARRAQAPAGTSYNVFGGFPIPVAGKTGTAERPPNADQSWYMVLAPYPEPEDRDRGHDRARRLRRRHRRAGAAQILPAYFDKQARGGRARGMQPSECTHRARWRRTRPHPSTTGPAIAERLGLPYLDGCS